MRDIKKVKKQVVKEIASAGDAEGGKEGLDGWTGRDSARPWPIARDGRADSTCCAQTAALELVCTAWLRRKAVTAC